MHYELPEEKPGKPRQRSWHTIRKAVYERDGAICHVCGAGVLWLNYECGHIVDRADGGPDELSNVVTMCRTCNRLKSCHETRQEYIAWLAAGDWRESVIERIPNGSDLLHIYLGTPESDAAEKRLRVLYPEL